jgi:hypothetical protein
MLLLTPLAGALTIPLTWEQCFVFGVRKIDAVSSALSLKKNSRNDLFGADCIN